MRPCLLESATDRLAKSREITSRFGTRPGTIPVAAEETLIARSKRGIARLDIVPTRSCSFSLPDKESAHNDRSSPYPVSAHILVPDAGPQGPAITTGVRGSRSLGVGYVAMNPRLRTHAHRDRASDIVVTVVSGTAATVYGEELQHNAGDSMLIPAGTPRSTSPARSPTPSKPAPTPISTVPT
ncbi:Uncharacterized protein, RmlC-like cupin domain [Amycolatopsis rubida]|uniref:Uncharacterized protein, RmlC-like cupin domain n=1 Tax=Amycolatopsis rubida TaxID=112413 RepID=A0A1I5VK38_9PSEU|nr:Uncharacterized protein, RmlC-like cupin domain [Amycolatopsis rubida]